MRTKTYLILFALLLHSVSGCRKSGDSVSPPPIDHVAKKPPRLFAFRDSAAEMGLSARYTNGEEDGSATMLETLGGGVALLDYDGDGALDLICTQGGSIVAQEISGAPTHLYRQSSSRSFVRVDEIAGLDSLGKYTHGAFAADYNNDGFVDVLITSFGGASLFANQGDGTFVDATEEAGIPRSGWTTGAAWGDINRDGSLDLYVARYLDWSFENHPHCPGPYPGQREVCPPARFTGLDDDLLISNGNGSFRSGQDGLQLQPGGKGLAVLAADLDNDRDLDIYVGNDGVANFLYRNDAGESLHEIAHGAGAALSDEGHPDGSMGVAPQRHRQGRPAGYSGVQF